MSITIMAGIAVGRSYESDFIPCLLRLLRSPNVRFFPRGNDALIERSRSYIATYFLEQTDLDVLFTCDSDVLFDAGDVQTICQQAHDLKAIVGGAYVTRSRERCVPTSYFLPGQPMVFDGTQTPQPVKWVATGFMAVDRSVVAKIAARPDMPLCHPKHRGLRLRPMYLPMVVPDDEGDPIFLSEDWAFCERAREEGVTSYINPGVRLLHQGDYAFRLEDMFDHPAATQPLIVTRSFGSDSRYKIETLAPEPSGVTEAVPV